ncbi:MAG: alanine racemase [Planctomycetota bacterium]|nr:alanine racemase [Planctomycetota bacterium]
MPNVTCVVDLAAVRHNVSLVKGLLGPGVELMAVVKANAYGHGAVRVAKAMLEAGADRLAVADAEEGLQLRESGIRATIQVLGPVTDDSIIDAVAAGLILSPSSIREIDLIAREARAQGRIVTVHLPVDTGMGRNGFAPDEAHEAAACMLAKKGLHLEGVFSHFASAADDEEYTKKQAEIFRLVCDNLRYHNINVPIRHIANSAAAVFHPGTHLEMVRPGIILYGLRGWAAGRDGLDIRPVLSVKSKLACIRSIPRGSSLGYLRSYRMPADGIIGFVPAGYHDGYMRALSNRGMVLVRGVRAPVVGMVSMDSIMVDLTNIARMPGRFLSPGEEVVLIGNQGNERISAEELGALAGTIPYEITCRMGARARFVYEDLAAERDEWEQRPAPPPEETREDRAAAPEAERRTA